jgi:hypothetical protein
MSNRGVAPSTNTWKTGRIVPIVFPLKTSVLRPVCEPWRDSKAAKTAFEKAVAKKQFRLQSLRQRPAMEPCLQSAALKTHSVQSMRRLTSKPSGPIAKSRPIRSRELNGFGKVELHRLDAVGSSNAGSFKTSHRCVWRPNPQLWESCFESSPPAFSLTMDCHVGLDGNRLFLSPGGPAVAICQASMLGFCVLYATGRMNHQKDRDTKTALQLFQLSSKLHAVFARKYKRESDLQISIGGGGRSDDVLPDQLAVSPGCCRRWTIAELMKRGRESAQAKGQALNEENCIAFGLYEAAKVDPVNPDGLTRAKVRQMLRIALFDLGPCPDAVDKGTQSRVRERFMRAVEGHCDDTEEDFRCWLTGAVDNIVGQIAKKKGDGGQLIAVSSARRFLRKLLQRILPSLNVWTSE